MKTINEGIIKDYGERKFKDTTNISDGLMTTEQELIDLHFEKDKGKKVLVLGCGGGRELFALKRMGFDVTGVDLVPKLINFAREYSKENQISVRTCISDIKSMPFLESESFDYAVMFKSVIGHVKERVTTFEEIKRILKPNGKLIFSTYYKYGDWKRGILVNLHNLLYWISENVEWNSWETEKNCYVNFPSIRNTTNEINDSRLKLLEVVNSKDIYHYKYFVVRK